MHKKYTRNLNTKHSKRVLCFIPVRPQCNRQNFSGLLPSCAHVNVWVCFVPAKECSVAAMGCTCLSMIYLRDQDISVFHHGARHVRV